MGNSAEAPRRKRGMRARQMVETKNSLDAQPDAIVDVEKATRAQQRERSRSAILKTAIKLFAERGFEGVRLDEVAHAAGVRRTLVLYYFSSKEELWQAAGVQVSDAFNKALHDKAREAREHDPEHPIVGNIAASLDAYLQEPDYPRFLVREGGVAGPRLEWLIKRFAHIDVNYGSPEIQNLLRNTIVRDVFFAILLSMAALGPLMDAWLSRVAGRRNSGLHPMSPESRLELVEVLTLFLSNIDQTAKPPAASRKRAPSQPIPPKARAS